MSTCHNLSNRSKNGNSARYNSPKPPNLPSSSGNRSTTRVSTRKSRKSLGKKSRKSTSMITPKPIKCWNFYKNIPASEVMAWKIALIVIWTIYLRRFASRATTRRGKATPISWRLCIRPVIPESYTSKISLLESLIWMKSLRIVN